MVTNMTIGKPKEMLDEIEPIVTKYEPSVVCTVCISVLGRLVHMLKVDKREVLQADITTMIEDTVKRLDRNDKTRKQHDKQRNK